MLLGAMDKTPPSGIDLLTEAAAVLEDVQLDDTAVVLLFDGT